MPPRPHLRPAPEFLLTEDELRAVLGPGQLGVELDEVLNGAGLPPTCDHYEWDDRSITPDSTQVHMVTALENRLPYETVTISDYVFATADDASRVMDLRRADFAACDGFVQRNLEIGRGELVDLALADEASMYVATATSASTRGVAGVGGGQTSVPLEQPALVCWVQVRSGQRVVIVGAFGSQQDFAADACRDLAGTISDRVG